MTDYNKKLNELMEEAKSNGYTFGTDFKFHKDPEYIYVIEIFWIWNSTYEEAGMYHIYKHTFKITDEEYRQAINFGKKRHNQSIHYRFDLDDEGLVDDLLAIDDIIAKYDTSYIDFLDTSTGGDICIYYQNDYYNKYTERRDAECVDLLFSKKDDNFDFPRGYVSFYRIEAHDYTNSQSIDLHVNKFLKDN